MFESPWYSEGLRFSCTKCGNCCRGPGYVWVDESEVHMLARHFEMDDETFTRVYTRKVGRNVTLREQANDNCIFYEESAGCLVYESRPRQCRTWPFWQHNLESKQDWEKVKDRCLGSDKGQLYTVEEISARLHEMKQK